MRQSSVISLPCVGASWMRTQGLRLGSSGGIGTWLRIR
ncbi:hypothetical protein LINPERPRIM_LOCUS41604 [Linum perenne]